MAPSFRDILSSAKKEIREVSVDEVKKLVEQKAPVKLIDVRESDEFSAGKLPGAISVPRGFLELRIEDKARRDEELVLYCAGGTRSALAAKTLREMGYEKVASMAGGYNRWHDAAYPTEKPFVLSAEQKERYRRHLIIPEVGEEGQAKLLKSRVLLMGAGGLGSPAALYLAAAGVGTLGIIDMDTVDLSNLQRQVIHTVDRKGMAKAADFRIIFKSEQIVNSPFAYLTTLPAELRAAIRSAVLEMPERDRAAFDAIYEGKGRPWEAVDNAAYQPIIELNKFVDSLRRQRG